MHPTIFQTFDDICRARAIRGSVLEIGATPDDSTLLNLSSLAGASEKIGINIAGASRHKDFAILEADANAMTCFPDQRFDAVLCNVVLEHDRFFWKTLAEIRHVTKTGGFVVIGTPGYTQLPFERLWRRFFGMLPHPRRYPAAGRCSIPR